MRPRIAAAVLAVLVATGCGSSDAPAPAADAADAARKAADDLTGTVDVFAAASLTDAFTELGDAFGAEHPGVTVSFSFGGSSGLAQQIVAGAPADVFAAASPQTMATVVDAGRSASEPQVFARNVLQIAVPAGNPGGVTELADLADPDLTVALCAEQVPCGAAAVELLSAAGVTAAPDTLEQDVRAALSKVRLGEVDAALVYRTDVLSAGDEVEGIEVPGADVAANDYPVTVVAGSADAAAARAFVDLVLSAQGREALDDAGFERP
jgi:molybdate transport system substrate-binding protein